MTILWSRGNLRYTQSLHSLCFSFFKHDFQTLVLSINSYCELVNLLSSFESGVTPVSYRGACVSEFQGDKGGERVLQKKWTTFLKAQLLCSLPEDGFPFNIIQDMFVLTPSKEDWKNTVFYGVFTSQW